MHSEGVELVMWCMKSTQLCSFGTFRRQYRYIKLMRCIVNDHVATICFAEKVNVADDCYCAADDN